MSPNIRCCFAVLLALCAFAPRPARSDEPPPEPELPEVPVDGMGMGCPFRYLLGVSRLKAAVAIGAVCPAVRVASRWVAAGGG